MMDFYGDMIATVLARAILASFVPKGVSTLIGTSLGRYWLGREECLPKHKDVTSRRSGHARDV
ncbi:hypothetical protein Pan189_37750 [Stratiformator vulcanicus]|uniref:Uncharacterized protein n=1 Tax=Stratiformator vulcanicus TaxID=2527980 RepID=A0A517R673_9PLAN|nr:hypothetical protein Pan189_37750 [Stratiformator vulcanicus]